jgi:hypothetical protein
MKKENKEVSLPIVSKTAEKGEVEAVLPAWYRLRRHSAGSPNFPDIKKFTRAE